MKESLNSDMFPCIAKLDKLCKLCGANFNKNEAWKSVEGIVASIDMWNGITTMDAFAINETLSADNHLPEATAAVAPYCRNMRLLKLMQCQSFDLCGSIG